MLKLPRSSLKVLDGGGAGYSPEGKSPSLARSVLDRETEKGFKQQLQLELASWIRFNSMQDPNL